jgi:phosphoglycolate phosphatase
MRPSNLHTLIFDFDYTLADSSWGVLSCNNYALTKLGYPRTTYQESCQTIGLSLWETYARLTADAAENGDEFVRLFIERAEEVMADRTVLFEETPGTILALKERGYTLGIVSTKFRYRIKTILQREDLLGPFEVIVGGEDVSVHKPDPQGLLLALDRLRTSSDHSVYIGDSLVDAKTAENVGIPFVAVLSGVTPAEAFDGYDVILVLESIQHLPQWVDQIEQKPCP